MKMRTSPSQPLTEAQRTAFRQQYGRIRSLGRLLRGRQVEYIRVGPDGTEVPLEGPIRMRLSRGGDLGNPDTWVALPEAMERRLDLETERAGLVPPGGSPSAARR